MCGTGLLDPRNLAKAIHMATHQVTAQAIGQAQRRFKIDPPSLSGHAHPGWSGQGFGADISLKPITAKAAHREAHPVDRHAVAQVEIGQLQRRVALGATPRERHRWRS